MSFEPLNPADVFAVPEELMHPLAALYDHESSIVNQGRHLEREFTVSWQRDELVGILEADGVDGNLADPLFDHLLHSRRLVPLSNGRYRTDTCETVRLCTFNYNRFVQEGDHLKPTQSGVTWSIERKETPAWEHGVPELLELLESEFTGGWDDDDGAHTYDDPVLLLRAATIVLDSFDEVIQTMHGVNGCLSRFQFRSLRDLLRGSQSSGSRTQGIVAGTGAGKSYGFQLGTLISLVYELLAGDGVLRVHTILMYPRVALVLDQREGVTDLIKEINSRLDDEHQIRWATDAKSELKLTDYQRLVNPQISDKDLKSIGIMKAIEGIYGSPSNCPHIVFANPDSLRNRLWNSTSTNALTETLKHVVFDEIHLLESITGANGAMVLRRLLGASGHPEEIMVTGSTATVADPPGHIGNVFSRQPDKVIVSTPDADTDAMELTGLIHHVIHRSEEGQNFQSNLANLTSIITHSRRRRLVTEDADPKDRHKTIGFADSLQLLGSWNYLIMDSEGHMFRNSVQQRLKKNDGSMNPGSRLGPETNSHSYRFCRPLVHGVLGGFIDGPSEDDARAHCDSCISGTPSTLPISTDDGFASIAIDANKAAEVFETSWEPQGLTEIGITDGCPYFQMGLCWREERDSIPEPIFDDGPEVLSNSVRPLLLTSHTISSFDDDPEVGPTPDEYFRTNVARFHTFWNPVNTTIKNLGHKVDLDIAISSPAMEVGVDLTNLNDAVLFKAIRNIASYRQKVGRIGRERFRDSYSGMLASFRAIDYHYYRNPVPLLNNDRLEPIPLAVDNVQLRAQACFHAVLDWLTIGRDGAPLTSNLFSLKSKNMPAVVRDAVDRLKANRANVDSHLQNNLAEIDVDIRSKAINSMIELLNLFLEDISPLLTGKICLADFLGRPCRSIALSPSGDRYRDACMNIRDGLGILVSQSPFLRKMEIDGIEQFVDDLVDSWKKIGRGEDANKLKDAVEWFKDNSRDLGDAAHLMRRDAPTLRESVRAFDEALDDWQDVLDEGGRPQQLLERGSLGLGLSFSQWNAAANHPKFEHKWWYLDKVVAGLHLSQHRHPHTFPENLFEPPNLLRVSVWFPAHGNDEGTEERVPITEALFAYAPGMWTYRKSGAPLKSKAYKGLIRTSREDIFTLPLTDLDGEGRLPHQFVEDRKIDRENRPWGIPLIHNPRALQIIQPTKINMMRSRGIQNGHRVKPSETVPGLIADGDDLAEAAEAAGRDDDDEGEGTNHINVPECIPIQWRLIEGRSLEPIESFTGGYEVEFHPDPMISSLFDDVQFDDVAEASEFVLGHVRKYQGGGGPMVLYVDNRRDTRSIALGHTFTTKAIRFHMRPDVLVSGIEAMRARMDDPSGNAHRHLFWTHFLLEVIGLSRFQAEHTIRLLLRKHPGDLNDLESWRQALLDLVPMDIATYCREWIDAMPNNRDPCLTDLEDALLDMATKVTSDIVAAELLNWCLRTLTNSLGIHLSQAGRAMSGCRDEDLGYHVQMPQQSTLEELDKIHIWLYDRAPGGNGTCQTIRAWFHIPSTVRELHTRDSSSVRTIPSKDFVDTLVDFLRPCRMAEGEAISISAIMDGVPSPLVPRRLRADFEHLTKNCGPTWIKLRDDHGFGSDDHDSARILASFLGAGSQIEAEIIRKAAHRCSTSCPECLEEFGASALGPMIGPIYADKRSLDELVRIALATQGDTFRRAKAGLDDLALGLDGMGEMDLEAEPIRLRSADGERLFRPLRQPENLWAEVDIANPIDLETGEVNEYVWIRMHDGGWG